MKKKLFLSLLCTGIILGITTGCENNLKNNLKTKGNCIATECIKKIEPENTVEEINSIIGFEGEYNEKYDRYYWELSEDAGVEVKYSSTKSGLIYIYFDRNSVANGKVNFSRYDELDSKIRKGISYQEFISYIGNVEGTIIEKDGFTTKYVWVSTDGSYLEGSFSNKTGECTFASGRFK